VSTFYPGSHRPSKEFSRPRCMKCGAIMWLTRIEPAGMPGHDLRTFECTNCGRTETVTVKFGDNLDAG
jgi:hypothetical protein